MQVIKQHKLWAAVLVVLLALCALVVAHSQGWAADLGRPKAQAAPVEVGGVSWTGVSLDLHGSLVTGLASMGSIPVDAASTGQMAGATLAYNYRFGSSPLVAGIDVSYDYIFGDLHTLGVNREYGFGGRLGFLATYKTLVYGRGEWVRAEATGGHSDGWGLGAGIEVKLADAPMNPSVALEYVHDWFDHQAFGPMVDVASDRITARFRLNFDFDPVRSIR